MNIYNKKIRTIKFRGKTPQGKWVYGYYLIREEESPVIETSVPYTIHYIVDYADFNGLNENEILPETLGQFSGVYTIGNKEIYEGDIIKFYNKMWEVVCDYEDAHLFYLMNIEDLSEVKQMSKFTRGEVIGNIHDNPELFKQ